MRVMVKQSSPPGGIEPDGRSLTIHGLLFKSMTFTKKFVMLIGRPWSLFTNLKLCVNWLSTYVVPNGNVLPILISCAMTAPGGHVAAFATDEIMTPKSRAIHGRMKVPFPNSWTI